MAQYLAGQVLDGCTGHEAGRTLLRQLYETHVGGPFPEIRLTPLGKPCFVDSSWHFSISHTRHHAFCVLADHPVGIDAEEQTRPIRPETARKLLSDREFARYQQAQDPNEAMLRLWVLKEATAKLAGTGIRTHPNTTDFSPDDPRVQLLQGCLVAVVR
jgi:phosphopantetheinyl transferase